MTGGQNTTQRTTGAFIETTVAGELIKAFVPHPLPPSPPVEKTTTIQKHLDLAVTSLAELKIASNLVPSPDFFNYAFVRKEAVLSSQIEGIQTTLADVLKFDADPDTASKDVIEVCNHVDALNFARQQLNAKKGLPLSLRLLRETHKRLMRGVRGKTRQPGEFRNSQNWIGGSRPGLAHFVPPPPSELKSCLGNFETFLHQDSTEHALIRIGLAHVQFETIHPFLDGNGRLGRLLIALLLENCGFLDARLLYLSLYFRRNQQQYYDHLDAVRKNGDWEGWIEFFLKGISEIAAETVKTSQTLFKVIETDRKRLLATKNAIIAAIRLFEELPHHPVLTIQQTVELLEITKPTAAKAIDALIRSGILKETTGGKRNRVYRYEKYMNALRADS